MSERIRYRSENGVLQSVQTFKHETNGAQYKVVLDVTTGQWQVVDPVTSLTAASGAHIKRNIAQIQIRHALASLGVVLSTEKRAERTKKA